MNSTLLINGQWVAGNSESMTSANPVSQDVFWQGNAAGIDQVDAAVDAARNAFPAWRRTSLDDRMALVRRFAELVFEQLEMNPDDYIEIDPRYFRPAEVNLLLGDASKAKEKLGWTATTSLEELAQLMVDSDMELARKEAVVLSNS